MFFRIRNLIAVLALRSHLCAGKNKRIDYEELEKSSGVSDTNEDDEQYHKLKESSEEHAKRLGPQMVFVTLDSAIVESKSTLASQWTQLLWTGGVQVKIYDIGEMQILLSLQRGQWMEELQRFLNSRPQVKEFEWNSKKYIVQTE